MVSGQNRQLVYAASPPGSAMEGICHVDPAAKDLPGLGWRQAGRATAICGRAAAVPLLFFHPHHVQR